MEERLFRQLTFIKEIDKIKKIIRKSRHFTDDKFENDAEHSWHLAMMAMLLAEYAKEPVDVFHVIRMVLIHDLVEIDAGGRGRTDFEDQRLLEDHRTATSVRCGMASRTAAAASTSRRVSTSVAQNRMLSAR